MSNPNLSLVLQFSGQYDPAVEAELQQMAAAIQQWANGLTGVGQWVDIPFDPTLFRTNSTGSITVKNNRPYVFQYCLIGDTLIIQVAARLTVNNGTTTEIRVQIPGGYTPNPYADISDGNQAENAGIFNSAAVAGATGVFIDTAHNCLSIQRWDGIAAAGFPNAEIFIRTTSIVRIKPKSLQDGSITN